tara:strand:+ start:60 stop:239 length:180 start_codon:yes stop_codon:yes gene_type:complete
MLLVDVALTLNRIPLGNSLVAENSITSIGGLDALMVAVGNTNMIMENTIKINTDEMCLM